MTVDVDVAERDDALVFVALERARCRCERLQDEPFEGVARELGLAAFMASERLDEAQREALRAEARARHAPPPDEPADALVAELRLLVGAAGELARETRDPAICEELHLARLHIQHALARLDGRSPDAPAASPRSRRRLRLPWRRRG